MRVYVRLFYVYAVLCVLIPRPRSPTDCVKVKKLKGSQVQKNGYRAIDIEVDFHSVPLFRHKRRLQAASKHRFRPSGLDASCRMKAPVKGEGLERSAVMRAHTLGCDLPSIPLQSVRVSCVLTAY
jgi:hypothetical protein